MSTDYRSKTGVTYGDNLAAGLAVTLRPAHGCMNVKKGKLGDTARIYGAFIKRLGMLGAVQCPKCRDYVYLDRHACGGKLPLPIAA